MEALPCMPWPPRPVPPQRLHDLPDDVLSRIIVELMKPVAVGPSRRVVESSYVAALPLAMCSTRLHSLFHLQLSDCELWQSGRLDNVGLAAIARGGRGAVRRMILRKCMHVSLDGLRVLAESCPRVRTIDLSYLNLTDETLAVVARGTAHSLRSLLVRCCVLLTDRSLRLIGERCRALEELDVCGLPEVTDEGVDALARGAQERLTMILCSQCERLTDAALESLGRWCPRLEVVTCRGLSSISNVGVDALCRGAGRHLAILDILDCDQLKVKGFLDTARAFCPQLARRYESVDGGSLRQIMISSLSGFIFHVTGSDIHNGKAAVYFLLVDSGTTNSFRVSIGSSSLNLTNYGSILASCFGETPNEYVKRTLLTLYGLDLDAEEGAR